MGNFFRPAGAFLAIAGAFLAVHAATGEGDFSWSNVSMGGGGFVSAVIASPVEKNVFYARTDVGGAYRWNEETKRWESMMDWVDVSELGLLGIEAIAVDPKDEGKVYMMAGTSYFSNARSALLRSTDYGKSWEVHYTWDSTGAKGGVVMDFGVHGNGMGRGNGEALAIDPNNTDIMFYGSRRSGLWKSSDNGSTWSHVDSWTAAAGSDTTWNGSGFSFVQFAPGSSSTLYAGFLREGSTAKSTFENVFTSTDAGKTWKPLPIPDALRTTAGGAKVRLMPQRAVVSKDGGTLTVTFADGAGPHSMGWDEGWGMIYDGFGRGAVLQCDIATLTWTDVSPEDYIDDGNTGASEYDNADYADMENYTYIAPYGGISINPEDPNEMVVTTEGYRGPQFWYIATDGEDGKWSDQWGSNIFRTTDGGKTWVASFKYYWMEGGYYPTVKQMDENGIGWMQGGSIHWSGSAAIDPFNPKRVFVSSGNGIFRCDNMDDYEVIPAGTFDSTTNYYYSSDEAVQGQVWHFNAHGIEETVPYEVVSIPGGPLVSVIADYDGFRHEDISKFPAHRHLTSVSGTNTSLGSTWALAYAPKSGTLVKVSATRAYEGQYNDVPIDPVQVSKDSGRTWSVATYGSLDKNYKEGTVAISTDGSTIVWVPGNGTTTVYRQVNSGWETVSGIDNASYVVGDPENASVFYAYNRTTGEFFRSEDKGGSFTKVSEPGKSNDKKFRAIPGYEGDLWLPIAERNETGDPVTGKLLHSTDGGKSWTPAEGIGYCEAVGYGKPKAAGGYPAIYAFGKVGETVGVFGSDDAGKTWTRVNDDGHEYGGLANGEFVMGDMNTYGVVYMSTAGRGIAARVPSDWNMGTSESGGTTAIARKAKPEGFGSVNYRNGNLEFVLNNASMRLTVFDMRGKNVYDNTFAKSGSVPVRSLAKSKGTYYVRATSNGKMLFSTRIAITR